MNKGNATESPPDVRLPGVKIDRETHYALRRYLLDIGGGSMSEFIRAAIREKLASATNQNQ